MRHFQRLLSVSCLACATLLAALLAAAPAKAAVLIDDFRDGFSAIGVPLSAPPAASNYIGSLTTASVPGGTRELSVAYPVGSTGTSVLIAGGGLLQATTSTGVNLAASTIYGQLAPLNLDLSGQNAFRLDLRWAGSYVPQTAQFEDDSIILTVYANTSAGLGLNPNGSAFSTRVKGGTVVDLPFASFFTNSVNNVPVNWADVDALGFAFTAGPSNTASFSSFGLASISAVPEPGPAQLLVAGIGVMVWLMRRRADANAGA
jgi:hypothetical protein